jgi:hypothetical protein
MAGQVIGTVNVQVNKQQNSSVKSLNYGTRTIRNSADLVFSGGEDGDAIIYQANTGTFAVAPVSARAITGIDAGFF